MVISELFHQRALLDNRYAGPLTATDHVYQAGNSSTLDRHGRLNGQLAAAPISPRGRDGLPRCLRLSRPAMHPSFPS